MPDPYPLVCKRGRRVRRLTSATSILFLLCIDGFLSADDKKDADTPVATINSLVNCGNVFGDQEVEVRFRIDARRALKGRFAWRYAVGPATAAAREIELVAGPDAAANIVIKLPIPPVKAGVVLQSRLTLHVYEAGQNVPLATVDRDIWIFPKDPFSDRNDWLKKLKITLYDPPGATKKVLDAAKVPFEEINTAAALTDLKEGLLLIGEGTSFKEEKDLPVTLDKLATRGLVVLFLAPTDGEIAIPGLSGPSSALRDLTMRRDIVRRLDKRLAPEGWPADEQAIASSITVKTGENGVVGEVTKGVGGWPWVEVRPEMGNGCFALCGHSIIARWETGPNSRFLLAKLLEHLTEIDSDKTKKGE